MQRQFSESVAGSLVVLPFIAYAETNGWFNEPLYRISPLLFWTADALFHVTLPALGFWFIAKWAGIRPSDYGLAIPPPLAKQLPAAALSLAGFLFLAFFVPERIAWALSGYPIPSFSYGQVVPNGFMHGPTVVYLAFSAGVVESALYIGLPWLIWRRLSKDNARRSLFIWISSTVFASCHWEQGTPGMIGAFLFGVVACALYFKIGDLWPIVGAHAAVDMIAFW